MIFEGDKSVIDAIKEKKRLLDAGEDSSHIRPLLIVGGGLMKGAYGTGAAMALEESGYSNVFTYAVGISVGGPIIAYLLSDNTKIGASVLAKEVASKEFFNLRKLPTACNTDYLDKVLQGATGKAIDAEKVLHSDTRFMLGATNYVTAKPEVLTPDNATDLFLCLKASYSMPGITKEPVVYKGNSYCDGSFASPHVIEDVVAQTSATHILVISNKERVLFRTLWIESLLNSTLFRFRMNAALRRAARTRQLSFGVSLKKLFAGDIEFGIVWGDGSIDSFERSESKVQEVTENSRNWWHNLLST